MSDVALEDLCLLIVDSEHKTAPKDPEGLHPLIRTTDLGRARADLTQAQRVNSEVHSLWTKRAVPGVDDLVLAREAPVGGIFRIPDGEEPVLGQRTVLLRPDPSVVDSRFLMYRLASDDMQARMTEMSTGSTVPHLNMADIRALPIPRIPPLSTQRRIAAVISAFDTLIEINERRIELLEDLARSLYGEWFVNSRFPGHEGEGSGTPLLPEGWEQCLLRDVVTTQYGVTTSASERAEGPRLLRGKDINKSSFIRWDQVPFCEITERDTEKYRLEVGDICVIRMADPGKVGIVESDVEAVFGSYLVRVRSIDSRLPPYLLFHYLDSQEYQDWVSGSSTGSTRKSASAAVLTEPKICLPPLEVAMQFERIASTLRRHLSALVEESANLAHIRDLLLPRLVTGQLDISDVDLGVLTPADPE